jgi:predicted aspartyl protease
MLPPNFTALSTKALGILREIITDCEVSAPCPTTVSPLDIDKIKTKALWDTGATNCCITKKTADSLNLKPIRITKVCYGDQETDSNVYLVNLHLPNHLNIRAVEATECYSKNDSFGLIIGMEVICLGDFSITNVNNKTTFSFRFPSIETIDYCKLAEELKQTTNRLGRNQPCYCGSGKKYKKCHGAP